MLIPTSTQIFDMQGQLEEKAISLQEAKINDV